MTGLPLRGLALLLAGLAAASCGSGGDPAPSAALDRGAYLETGNAACLRLPAAGTGFQAGASQTELAASAQRLADGHRTLADALDDLRPPPDLQGDHDRFREATRTYADTLTALAEAATQGDRSAFATSSRETSDQDRERSGIARRLGLTACASN